MEPIAIGETVLGICFLTGIGIWAKVTTRPNSNSNPGSKISSADIMTEEKCERRQAQVSALFDAKMAIIKERLDAFHNRQDVMNSQMKQIDNTTVEILKAVKINGSGSG